MGQGQSNAELVRGYVCVSSTKKRWAGTEGRRADLGGYGPDGDAKSAHGCGRYTVAGSARMGDLTAMWWRWQWVELEMEFAVQRNREPSESFGH